MYCMLCDTQAHVNILQIEFEEVMYTICKTRKHWIIFINTFNHDTKIHDFSFHDVSEGQYQKLLHIGKTTIYTEQTQKN